MTPAPDDKAQPATDPATVYERAKPKQESPSGKLKNPDPPKAEEEDHHRSQDKEPRDPHAKRT